MISSVRSEIDSLQNNLNQHVACEHDALLLAKSPFTNKANAMGFAGLGLIQSIDPRRP